MKALVRNLLFLSLFLIFGVKASNAAVTVTSYSTAGSNGLLSSPLNTVQTGAIFGFRLVNGTAASGATAQTYSSFTFNNTVTGGNWNTSFPGTVYLYQWSGNNYATGSQVALVGSTTAPASTSITITGSSSLAVNSTSFYFLVVSYTPNTNTTFQVNFASAAVTTGTALAPAQTGAIYTLYAGTLTITSLTTTPGNNGTVASPVPYGSTNYAVTGLSITGTGNTSTSTINTLTFYIYGSSSDPTASYYTTAYLYKSATSTYNPASPGTLVSQVNSSTSSQYVTFPSTAITIPNGTTAYYFIVLGDTKGDANTSLFNLGYNAETYTGIPLTTSGGTVGPSYTFAPMPTFVATITSLTTTPGNNGLSGSPVPGTAANYGVAAFSIVGSGAAGTTTISSLRFYNYAASSDANNLYFTTAYLYSSSSPTYNPASPGTLVGQVNADGSQYMTIPTNITVTNGFTMYYFVVLSDTKGDTNPSAFNVGYSSEPSYTGTALTRAANYTGPSYTFAAVPPVTATAAATTATAGSSGLIVNPVTAAVTNGAIYGLTITPSAVGSSKALTGLSFTTTSAQFNNYFYSTAYLYASTDATFDSGDTQISSVATGANNTISFTTFSAAQTIKAATPLYYFVVINYASPGVAATATTTVNFSSATTAAVVTNGSVTGPAYTFNPLGGVIAATVAPANLTASAIYVGQTNIAVSGISLQTNLTGLNTSVTQLSFAFTPTSAATAANYFTPASVKLVSSTSPVSSPFDYNTTTAVSGAAPSIAAGTITFNISPAPAVTTTPVYYYLVVDYTVTGGATNQTFTFKPASYTTALSGTVSPTYTANTFVCTQPTYYWTGNANNNWTNPNNWEVSVSPVLVNGYYPGQLGNTDNVDISPVAVSTVNTISVNTNQTVASIVFEPGVNTTLNIAGGKTLTTTAFTVGTTASTAAAIVTLSGTGTLAASGSSYLYNASTFNVNAGTLSLPIYSDLYFYGSSGYPSSLVVNGGTVSTVDSYYYMTASSYASIIVNSGTLTCNDLTFISMNSANDVVVNNGGTISMATGTHGRGIIFNYEGTVTNNTGGTMNVSGSEIEILSNAASFINNGGTLNLSAASEIYLSGSGSGMTNSGIVSLTGVSYIYLNSNPNTLLNTAGTFTLDGGSYVSFQGRNSTITNSGGIFTLTNTSYVSFVSISCSIINSGGVFNVSNNSYLNMNAANSTVTNSGGTFNVNGTSYIFMYGTTTILNNTAGYFNLGNTSYIKLDGPSAINNTGSGTFTCSPTSIIYFLYTGCTISNNSSNPFTLLSDATGSATFGGLSYTGDAVSGIYNVQRFVTGQNNNTYRNYRLLSSPVNVTSATASASGNNVIDLSYLSANATIPSASGTTTYNGAYSGGPGAGFPNYIANPLVYLYLESITPGATYNQSFISGKNAGVVAISTSPYTVTTSNTAAGGGGVNNAGVKIPAGNGYLLYYTGDNTRTTTSPTVPPSDSYITSTGYINQGTIPFFIWGNNPSGTLTYTTGADSRLPGITVVGNPYPSTIDLYAVYNDNSSTLSPTFYQLDILTQQYDTYNAGTGSSGAVTNRYIASGQGFYVTVNPSRTTSTLNFKEDQKIAGATAAIFPSPTEEGVHVPATNSLNSVQPSSLINNSVTANDTPVTPANKVIPAEIPPAIVPVVAKYPVAPDTTVVTTPANTAMHLKLAKDALTYDEIGLFLNPAWSDKADVFDSPDLDGFGAKVSLSSYTADNVRTSVNALGDYSKGKRIKLYVKATTDGIYQIQLEDIKNFKSAHYNIFVIDNQLHDSLDMVRYKTFNVNLVAADTASYANRFVLAIEHAPVPHYALLSFSGQKVTSGVQLNWKTQNESNYTGFVLQKLVNNSYVTIDSLMSDSVSSYDFIDRHPTLGDNVYRLQQNDVFGRITYTAPVTIGYNSNTSTTGNLTVYPNPAKTVINVALAASTTLIPDYAVDIYNAGGTIIGHRSINTATWTEDVSAYKQGVYVIQIKDKNGNLVGKAKFVKVD